MEVFISFSAGFAIGWASVWFIFCMKEIKEIEIDVLEYNNVGGKTLKEMIDSKYDPENYFKPEGTK